MSNDPEFRSKWDYPYSYDPFTIWKANETPTDSLYTDRLYRWDPAKHDKLCIKHFGDNGQYWGHRNPKSIQEFLRDYYDAQDLILCEIQEHCNQPSGYPLWYLAYKQ